MFKSKKDKLEKEYMKENMDELQDISEEENKNIEEKEMKEPEDKIEVSKEEDLQKQVEKLREQLLRKAAEFENYKKRNENELSSFFKYANESLIMELIPVLDDFDRVFSNWNEKHLPDRQSGEAGDAETFKKGIELVYEKLMGVLKKTGLKEMETNGKQFDFNLHDALLQIPDSTHEPNTILETAEKGYYLKDKVLRHAKVLVSAKPDSTEGKKDSQKTDGDEK